MPVEPSTDSLIAPAAVPAASTPNRWRLFWGTVTRFDRNKINRWIALRNTIGVSLPLGVGILTGHTLSGVAIAVGALNVAYSDGEDPYPQRARRMLMAGALTSAAVFVGGILGRSHPITVLVAALWAFASGLVVSLGTTAGDLGVISLVTLIVYSAQGLSTENAGWAALLAVTGSLFQTVLSLVFWPVRRYRPERRAIGQLYLELARVATLGSSAESAPPASQETTRAHQLLSALGQDRRMEGERYRSLLNQAERIRLCLLILARLERRMERENPDFTARAILDQYLQVSGDLLYSVGLSLTNGAGLGEARNDLVKLNEHANNWRALPREGLSGFLRATLEDAQLQIDALAGQLRAAVDLADHATPEGEVAFERREASKPKALRLANGLSILRANLTLQSTSCRHALRLAACVAGGEILSPILGLRRSYWLPMTVAIVLKPDFTSTFSRGVLRLGGTFAGLALATALFYFIHPSSLMQAALVAVFTYALRSIGPANYGVLVISISALIVILVGLTGVSASQVIPARAFNTAAGGVLALFAYWIWPTWEKTQANEVFALMLDAYRAYFRAISNTYQQDNSRPESNLDTLRLNARLSRSNVEASVDRLSAEPGVGPEQLNTYLAMLAASHRIVHALMALDAGLAKSSYVPAREAFKTFARDVDLTFYFLAAALRGSPYARKQLPDLREDHRQLLESGDPNTERYALVNVETDRLTNSLNTLETQISRLLAGRRN
jgi:uncharacterized membrane protein YccC